MNSTPLPANEAGRLEALRRYRILDTPPEPAYDELTQLAATTCQAPLAFLSFADADRLWLKSRIGIEAREVPRQGSFCAHAIAGTGLFEVQDTLKDERFAGHPLVANQPHLRFYAGMPLTTPDGYNLGVLCLMDRQPRCLSGDQREALRILAHQVITHLELQRHLDDLERSLGEAQRAKQALRESEGFFETLVESLPQFIIRKDRQGRFTFANRKFCQALGKTLPEILGQTDHNFYPLHLANKYHRDDLRVMSTREAVDTIEANESPGGGSIFVHVIKTPLVDPAGQVVGIQGIFWDVTERKTIEAQLAYERDLLRSLLDTTPDRIYFKDVASRFIRCSQSMAVRLGLSDAMAVVGKTDFDFHPTELARQYYQEEQGIILTGQALINKLQRTTDADGHETWSAVSKVPIRDRHGAITGLVGISRDVTELKQAEEALEQARDTALEHARLKSEFLANMSHEIRTPMNAIVGMADLLLDTSLSAEQREHLETLRNGIDTLLHLINEILDFSKIEAGKLVLETIDFDLRQVIESTAEMLAEHAHRRGVEMLCWIAPDLPTRLCGDPGRIRQVVTNLLSNAVKFTESGEVVLRATRESESPTHLRLRISVTDTGIGIAEKALPSIFEAFTQADGSTTRKYGGTGLGLAISRQLVELMHGRMGVDSTPGRGSTFWFTIPLGKQAPVQPAPPDPALSVTGARVLVVDDNATSRQFLHEQLSAWRVGHEAASTAIEAMTVLRKAAAAGAPFIAALVDMRMPEMDGLALAHAIKSDPVIAATRLVMLSSVDCTLDANTRATAGISACLVKPLKQARLGEALREVLLSGQSAPIPAVQPAPQAPPGSPGLRILLAEDNAVNQRLALKQLEKLGYQADAVMNGQEVLEAVARKPYDVILIDCQMPVMDGYETTARIRRSSENTSPGATAGPYIIALTANAQGEDRARGLAAGMNDYLTKPVRIEDLRRALQRAASSAPAAPASPQPSDDVLDASVLASLKDLREPGQPDPVAELVQLYLRDSKPKVEALECYAIVRKADDLKASAHSLKGSSNNLGARRLAALFQEVENATKAAHWDRVKELLPQVKAEFQRVQERLLAEIQA